jgi:hypothetical protein
MCASRYSASYAVDGDVEGLVSDVTIAWTADPRSHAHGTGDGNPWWEVSVARDRARVERDRVDT